MKNMTAPADAATEPTVAAAVHTRSVRTDFGPGPRAAAGRTVPDTVGPVGAVSDCLATRILIVDPPTEVGRRVTQRDQRLSFHLLMLLR
jgi:hypothetical protein